MAPPPATPTPTPHRFLVPKRSQPRNETPKAYQSGGQQFHATPRFSLYSTPRGQGAGGEGSSLRPSSSIPTPAPASARIGAGTYSRPTPRTTDPINDIFDSSPPFPEEQQPGGGGGANHRDPIEVLDVDVDVDTDVDAVPESSPVREFGDTHDDESSEEEEDIPSRSPKRRRISISSSNFSSNTHDSAQHEDDNDNDGNYDYDNNENEDTIMLEYPPSSPPTHHPSDSDTPEPSLPRPSTSVQQPTFQKAPRFKPIEAPEGGPRYGDPLPDTFSPHRRGTKYIPGGLAASVRDWFVDVWAGAAAKRDGEGEWIARVLVDGVQGSAGMTLVTGRYVAREEDGEPSAADDEKGARSARVVLAGSQKLVGLERGLEVRPGSVVGVGRPSWEAVVPGQGRWGVVCEWAVLR
ncbi:hypothetical protein F5Y00DRAFT_135461 [Daldinia vernicosa]|uniref:uncharacterized protein n=1 Tax=Daldinia vernicosa TaxID=114800 RepID=UPI002007A3AD|nr:uncharacterized protein F5Y00DRAFT_135461 [Daldinia vernicosa]KAI0853241.1 hypothetical protein F5Y00DRAFT_135461 [Daldinia vernicosa]